MSATTFEDVSTVFDTQTSLLNALAKHFGLPADRLMIGSHIEGGKGQGDTLQAVFRVALIDDDMVAAVAFMQDKGKQ